MTGVLDTGGKSTTGVVDTVGQFVLGGHRYLNGRQIPGVVDTGGKLVAVVNLSLIQCFFYKYPDSNKLSPPISLDLPPSLTLPPVTCSNMKIRIRKNLNQKNADQDPT